MTATLNPPPGVTFHVRLDPAVRLRDYCDALRFYCSLDSRRLDRIVFVDNSGGDVTELRRIADEQHNGKRVEVMSYAGNTHDPKRGRGYGEFHLIDHGLRHSTLVRPDEPFWKVTGRLQCENLFRMAASAPADYDLYVDLKSWRHKWCELRLYSCTPAAFRGIFLANVERVREDVTGHAPEIALYDLVLAARDRFRVAPRFRSEPNYRGFSGEGNMDLQSKPVRRKRLYRSVLRQVAPFFWT